MSIENGKIVATGLGQNKRLNAQIQPVFFLDGSWKKTIRITRFYDRTTNRQCREKNAQIQCVAEI